MAGLPKIPVRVGELGRLVIPPPAVLSAVTRVSAASLVSAAVATPALSAPIIPEGYVAIPEGIFRGYRMTPFWMKSTPVTNQEWFRGVDGRARFVTLNWDRRTGKIQLHDISDKPKAFLDPKINLDAGNIAIQGSQVLVKLVDNPSMFYDALGYVFSGARQPVIGVNYLHAHAWLLTQMLEMGSRLVFSLPTDHQYEYVASDRGTKKFGTETGKLYAMDGRKLAHFGEKVTVAVDDPQYQQQWPFGVQTTGNVWRWVLANSVNTSPYALRGGAWNVNKSNFLSAAFRFFYDPEGRHVAGLSPIVFANDSK